MTLSSHLKMTPCHLTMHEYIPSPLFTFCPTPPPYLTLSYYSKPSHKHRDPKTMTPQYLFPLFFFLIFFFHSRTISAQSPAAAPAPSGTNVTAVLEKAGQYTTFIKLLKSTKTADQINTQLSTSNQGITIFAPTDNAFASLKSGTLNSISEQQKLQLVQFHILPTFYSTSQFQTATNPLHTQAGNSDDGEFPLNVTTSGNQVNITTGVNTASVANTVFTDNQLAVYQVDQVLLPLSIFGTPAPAPAPAAPKTSVKGSDSPTAGSGSSDKDSTGDTSAAMGKHLTIKAVSLGVATLAAFLL